MMPKVLKVRPPGEVAPGRSGWSSQEEEGCKEEREEVREEGGKELQSLASWQHHNWIYNEGKLPRVFVSWGSMGREHLPSMHESLSPVPNSIEPQGMVVHTQEVEAEDQELRVSLATY